MKVSLDLVGLEKLVLKQIFHPEYLLYHKFKPL